MIDHNDEFEKLRNQDFQWFLDNYDDLFAKYGTAYIVIKNQTVIGVFPSCREAVRETQKTEPIGSFIVQYCDGTTNAYTCFIATLGISFVQ